MKGPIRQRQSPTTLSLQVRDALHVHDRMVDPESPRRARMQDIIE